VSDRDRGGKGGRHARFCGCQGSRGLLQWALHSDRYNAWKELSVKISARNRLKGRIVEVKKGATTAHVRLDVNGTIVTASITNEAVDELGLKAGQEAYAIIKASDVMMGLDG